MADREVTLHELVRNTASELYKDLEPLKVKVAEQSDAHVASNFPINVSCQLMAISIVFMVEEQKGVSQSVDEFVDSVFRVRRMISEQLGAIIAKAAGSDFTNVHVTVEEPDAKEGDGERAGRDEGLGGSSPQKES